MIFQLNSTSSIHDQRIRLQRRLRPVLNADLNRADLEKRLDYIAGDGLFDSLGCRAKSSESR